MNSPSELLSGLLMIAIIAIFAYGTINMSKQDKHSKELALRKMEDEQRAKAQAIQEEVDLANQASGMLPDVAAVMRILRGKYRVQAILETIRVFKQHLEILGMLDKTVPTLITLPNMQADRFNRDEKRVRKVAHEIDGPSNDIGDFGLDSLAQEPTVERLRELVAAGYVHVDKPIAINDREFACSLTEHGKALVKFDYLFCRGDTPFVWRASPCKEARELVSKVVHYCIQQMQINDTAPSSK